jgi:phosphatidylglycerol---prolipoprotein diacylglyceryl transferase
MANLNDYWVHDLSPFLIQFPESPLGLDGIRYYGLAYLLSFLAAWLLLRSYNLRGKFKVNADERASMMTAIILGVLVGGRMGYMFLYDLEAWMNNPLLFLRVDQGGMSSHGGFIGVFLALIWFARQYNCRLLELGDVVCTLAPIGLGLGRVANFINGELWGRVTTVPWAVIFPDSPARFNALSTLYGPDPRHPSQLYQAGLEGLLLLLYIQWRFWFKRPAMGQLAGEFLIGYGLLRIAGEFFRAPDAALILGMSRGQFYSSFMIVVGAGLIRYALKKAQSQP